VLSTVPKKDHNFNILLLCHSDLSFFHFSKKLNKKNLLPVITLTSIGHFKMTLTGFLSEATENLGILFCMFFVVYLFTCRSIKPIGAFHVPAAASLWH